MHVLITKKDGTRNLTFDAVAIETRVTNNAVEAVIKSGGHGYAFDLSLYDMHVDTLKEMMDDLLLEQTEQM